VIRSTWPFALGLMLAAIAQPTRAGADTARPDFNGLWQIAQAQKSQPPGSSAGPQLTPQAKQQYAENQAALQAGKNSVDTMSRCLPPGMPRIMKLPQPFKLVQSAHLLAFLFEWNHTSRWVYLDREHFEPLGPSYLGQSVAKWEGRTLVIDSTDFNATTFLDDSGLPHSEQLHVVERLTLKTPDVMEDRITLADPATFTRPWEMVLIFKKRPGTLVADDDWCIGRTGLVNAK
jgi:hypothetical protein